MERHETLIIQNYRSSMILAVQVFRAYSKGRIYTIHERVLYNDIFFAQSKVFMGSAHVYKVCCAYKKKTNLSLALNRISMLFTK